VQFQLEGVIARPFAANPLRACEYVLLSFLERAAFVLHNPAFSTQFILNGVQRHRRRIAREFINTPAPFKDQPIIVL
jgi:hypothetical protein